MNVTENYKRQHRYLIYDDIHWENGVNGKELKCQIKSIQDLSDATLCLMDLWADDGLIKKGYHVGIVGVELNESKCFVINKEQGYLILEPDTLISVTSVVSTYFCDRKTIFNERMRLPLNNRSILEGLIGHEMLGRGMVLKPEMRNLGSLLSIAWCVSHSPSIMVKAYGLGMSQAELSNLAKSLANYVLTFLQERCGENPVRNQSLQIERVVDIEDSIWSPSLGLKGKFDATIVAKSRDGQRFMTPLEFKTGHMDPTDKTGKADHVGQVMLYCLLMKERYENVTSGLLYYLKPNTLIECKVERKFLQPLILSRNRIVISQKLSNGVLVNLPRPSVNPKLCNSCEHRTTCSLLTRTTLLDSLADFKNKTEESLIKTLNYLDKEELDFFKAWFTVISAETEAGEKYQNLKSLWTVPSYEREKSGRCISKMVFVSGMDCSPNGYEGCFALFSRTKLDAFDFESLELQTQDLVVVSSDKDICLAYGIIQSIDPPNIIIKVDRLSSQFTASEDSRCFPIMTIDKIQNFSPTMVQYNYLQALMADDPRAARIRKYVIKKEVSRFPGISREEVLKHGSLSCYNRMQRHVIVNAIRTDSFLFVQGMPGTGKTNTIVGLLKFLNKMGKSVLVTAYTGTAVDNILLNCYLQDLQNFIRVGEPKLRHFGLIQRSDKTLTQHINVLSGIQDLFDNTLIVGTTLLNLKHEIFQKRKFDYLIVDEASQALPSSVFGALLLADKYIIVGDPDQLPTVMQSSVTRELNLADNFFSMMATEDNTKVLNIQYRMNNQIMRLSNELVYGGKMMSDGTAAKRCLKTFYAPSGSRLVKFLKAIEQEHGQPKASFLRRVLHGDSAQGVVFINTEGVESKEVKSDSSIANITEAKLVVAICEAFEYMGMKSEQIGVLAPYRGQVNLIRSLLRSSSSDASEIEVNTVDQYQGRDKEVIICTFTKTKLSGGLNSDGILDKKGGILEDIRRLNVALTRAKYKLIMIGHKPYLSTYDPLKKLFGIMYPSQIFGLQNGWDVEGFPDAVMTASIC